MRTFGTVLLGSIVLGLVLTAQAERVKIAIRGKVTKAGSERILVEGKKEADTEHDKASIRITKSTRILKVQGNKRVPATIEDIKEGVIVEATFTGPVAESYPVQATAKEISILSP